MFNDSFGGDDDVDSYPTLEEMTEASDLIIAGILKRASDHSYCIKIDTVMKGPLQGNRFPIKESMLDNGCYEEPIGRFVTIDAHVIAFLTKEKGAYLIAYDWNLAHYKGKADYIQALTQVSKTLHGQQEAKMSSTSTARLKGLFARRDFLLQGPQTRSRVKDIESVNVLIHNLTCL